MAEPTGRLLPLQIAKSLMWLALASFLAAASLPGSGGAFAAVGVAALLVAPWLSLAICDGRPKAPWPWTALLIALAFAATGIEETIRRLTAYR